MTLEEAIAEVRRCTPPNSPWTGDEFTAAQPEHYPSRVDIAIAVILNAALDGKLAPPPQEPKP